jgi:hypothetical protein
LRLVARFQNYCRAIFLPLERLVVLRCWQERIVGTNEYLEKLNLDQLRYAVERANQLIAAKKGEKKVVIWRVCERSLCLKEFAGCDYLLAVDFLAETAREMERTGAELDEKELGLIAEVLPESEAAERL